MYFRSIRVVLIHLEFRLCVIAFSYSQCNWCVLCMYVASLQRVSIGFIQVYSLLLPCTFVNWKGVSCEVEIMQCSVLNMSLQLVFGTNIKFLSSTSLS